MTNPDFQRHCLECPKCGKLTVVQHKGVYQCIACDFKRDLDQKEEKPKQDDTFGNSFLAFLIAGVILFLLL